MILKSKITRYTTVILAPAECVEDGGKYELVCVNHGFLIQDDNKKRLWKWADWSFDWCATCHDEHEAVGGFHDNGQAVA